MRADPNHVRDLFLAALEVPLESRGAYLTEVCGGDDALRTELEQLLAAHADPDSILEPPPAAVPTACEPFEPHARPASMATGEYIPESADESSHPKPIDQRGDIAIGSIIAGRYKLIEVIGEGGMGSVFLAEQTEPVKRQVALKLIRSGMDTKLVLARFDAERQALALMDHPNIARVYDGGTTPPTHVGGSPMPFFVMELVHGIPLTLYCDEHRLTVASRLELFVSVCQAVQHAHQKGIIHRDLKPGNVLVTEVDGRPTPKVIDFGVAKAIEQKLTDQSIADLGAIVGTPAYMSPEQADPTSMDIDTRTDVYALGVMLYELLSGTPPIDAKQFKRGAILEMLRMVREEEAPRPSTKLSSSEALPNIAASRSIEPAKLAKLLRGELDWIVLKALEKDRTRRYETANGFARDIQRYLADEVVEARSPTAGYRLKKFARRNRGQVMAASLVVLVLLAGIAGTTFGLIRAEHRRQDADNARAAEADRANGERLAKIDAQNSAAAEKAANERAQKRLREVAKSNEILGSIFDSLDPKEIAKNERPLQAILVEKLDKAVAQLEGEAIGDPLVVATMQTRFGRSLLALNEPKKAIILLEKARKTLQSRLGADDPETLAAMLNLAVGYLKAGKLKLSLDLYKETYDRAMGLLGPDHPITSSSMNDLAYCYEANGKLDQALPLFKKALELRKKELGPNNPTTLATMNNLAGAYQADGKLEMAVALFKETLEVARSKFGPKHPDTLLTANNLALAYEETGKWDLAIPLLEETLKLQKELLGSDNTETLGSINNLALAYQRAGQPAKALPLLEDLFKRTKAKLGADHPHTLLVMGNLAEAYRDLGKLDLALPLMEETLKLTRAKLGPEHPDTLMCVNNLATAYGMAGKLKEALPLLKETLAQRKKKLGPDHPDTLMSMNNLARCYVETGQFELALPLMAETLRIAKVKLGPEHPNTVRTMINLAGLYEKTKKLDLAVPLYEDALRILKANVPPEHPIRVAVSKKLLMIYEQEGKSQLALALVQEAYDRLKAKLGPDHRDTLAAANDLARQYWMANQLDKSIPMFEALLKRDEAKFGRNNLNTLMTIGNLGVNYKDAGKFDKALPLLEEAYRAAKTFPTFRQVGPQLLDGYLKAGKIEQATTLSKDVLADLHKQMPKESPQLAGALAKLGLAMLNAKAFDLADPVLGECLTIREKKMADSWLTFSTESMRGEALLGQKKYAEAEQLLLKGYQGMKQRERTIPPQGSARIPEALDRLIELYSVTNRPAEVKKWRAERAKCPAPVEKAPMPREKK